MAVWTGVRAEALGMLPQPYALALVLRSAGVTEELIAQRLQIEPEAVGPLLAVAELKLDAAVQGLT